MIVFLTHKINPKSFLSNFWGSLQKAITITTIDKHTFFFFPKKALN